MDNVGEDRVPLAPAQEIRRGSVVLACLSGLVIVLMRTQQVVNPAFVTALEEKTGDALPGGATGFALVLLVIGIAVWDSVDSVLKYLRGRRAQRPGILSER